MSAVLSSVPTRTLSLRRLWLKLHRWLALSVGWVLAAVGLMGALLVVARPLDQWAHPALFRAATPGAGGLAGGAPLEAIRQRLVERFGSDAGFTLRPPREPGESLSVAVRGGGWSGTVYLDPQSGAEQGRRGETEGFVNVLFKLHSSLLLQDTGKALLAWIALAYLFLLASGLLLWWPRHWPPKLRIELRRGLLRGLFDLHRTGGALLGLLIAVSVASGAYMAWRPLGEFVTALSGETPVKPPKLPKSAGATVGAAPTLDALVERARAQFPGAALGFIQLAGRADRPLRVRLRLSDDPHPNGLSSVWLDPRDGAVLAARRWNELDPGARATAIVYPLHTGELGGPLLEALAMLSGLALGGLGITGLWLWWRRRRRSA